VAPKNSVVEERFMRLPIGCQFAEDEHLVASFGTERHARP
jgi:hypothetical protein